MRTENRLAWLVALVAFTMGSATAAPHDAGRFLMQGHTLLADGKRHARTVGHLAEAGVTMFRDEVYWSNVEREKGVLEIPPQWNTNLDMLVEAGIEPLLILNYSNALYDEGMAPHTPEARAAFARFCTFMVQETRGRIKYFEIWNEPNVDGFWPPKENPEDYAALLKEASAAVRDANPEAFVIGCSLSLIDNEFLATVLENGGYEAMDALSIHPYCHPQSPEAANIWERMAEARALTAQYGDPLPVWVTELGFPTHRVGGVSEREQANFLARSYVTAMTLPWLETFGWYWFGPDGPDPLYSEDNFGLLRHDWSHKPSFHAMRTVTDAFGEAWFERTLEAPEGVSAHVFALPEGDRLTALWSWKESRSVSAATNKPATLILRNGERITLSPRQGRLLLDLTGDPVYLRTAKTPEVSFPENPIARFDLPHNEVTSAGSIPLRVVTSPYADLSIKPVRDMVFRYEVGTGSMPPITASRPEVPVPVTSSRLADGTVTHDYWTQAFPGTAPGNYPTAALLIDMETGEAFGRLATDLRVKDPLSLVMTPFARAVGEPRQFRVSIKNTSSEEITGRILLKEQGGASLEPSEFAIERLGAVQRHEETIAIVASGTPDRVYRLEAKADLGESGSVTFANQISYMVSPRVARSPRIDGDLSDWPGGFPIRLERRDQITGELAPWDGPEGGSALVWTAWDDEWFYFAGEVNDQLLSDVASTEQIYKNDGFEVYFDTDHDGDSDETGYSHDDTQLGLFMEAGEARAFQFTRRNDYLTEARIAINRAPAVEQTRTVQPRGYIVEAAIPLAAIALEPRPGLLIGFNVAMTDDDTPRTIHPFGQDVQLSWTGVRQAWQRPAAFADLFLVAAPSEGHVAFEVE